MKKKYIIYTQGIKTKKAVIDENMYRVYKANPDIQNIQEFESETLMEKTYAESIGIDGKKILLG